MLPIILIKSIKIKYCCLSPNAGSASKFYRNWIRLPYRDPLASSEDVSPAIKTLSRHSDTSARLEEKTDGLFLHPISNGYNYETNRIWRHKDNPAYRPAKITVCLLEKIVCLLQSFQAD